MELETSEIVAIVISLSSLTIIAIIVIILFQKIKTEIQKNSLKNSTIEMLEIGYWNMSKTNKDLSAKLNEAMADSIRAHEEVKILKVLNKKLNGGH